MTAIVKKMARAVVLRAAGTNCELETKTACERAGFWTDILHVNRLAEAKELLRNYHLLIIPGGFTYGDDIGAGKVLANEIRCRLGDSFRNFLQEGRLMMGICNGFQVLVKTGLLPDPSVSGEQSVTLTNNDSMRYEDRWVHLKICSRKSEFIQGKDDAAEGVVIQLPVAHGEGKFVSRDTAILKDLERNGQIVLKYVDPSGKEAGYPWNPNGSPQNIAGICDPTGRVLGLMPHPERFADPLLHPEWMSRGRSAKSDGMRFFDNAFAYVDKNLL